MHQQTLRMSVLSGILRIQDYCSANPQTDPTTAANVLKNGSAVDAGFDYPSAVQAITALELPHAHPSASSIEALQTIIAITIKRFRPPWSSAISYGRNQLLRLLSPDEQQCLASARLLDPNPPDHVVAWWDELAAMFRVEANKENSDTGRLGEKLSLHFECQRLRTAGLTNLSPRWVSIDDNSLGYDIASFETDAIRSPRFIEVKASNTSPPQFFITRNEWRAATRLQSRYVFHVWELPNGRLAELSTGAMAVHIPVDSGFGAWQQVRVHMSVDFWDINSNGPLPVNMGSDTK